MTRLTYYGMARITRLIGISLLLSIILLGCSGVAVAVVEEQIIDPTAVNFYDNFVIVATVTNVEEMEFDIIIIFTDNSLFYSEDVFKLFFELSGISYTRSDEMNIARIRGFGTVDEKGFFGEWTPADGYKYYPLT
ncbi:MAG: hypothetical protein FWF19_03030 [Euryarchaeota archaeon]|nr:hypothetical protein [Euryarchaeota archaeon]